MFLNKAKIQDFSRRQLRQMKLFISIAILVTISCTATDTDKSEYFSADKELLPYFEIAVNDLESIGVDFKKQPIRLQFTESIHIKNVIAVAYGMNNDYYINIMVSKEWWLKLSHSDKKWVMMHEILHDYYNFKHESCMFLNTKLTRTTKKKYERALVDLKHKLNGTR